MYDLTFYSKKYKCPLMCLLYLEIIDPTLIFLFIKKWMLHRLLAYMQLNQTGAPQLLKPNSNKRMLFGDGGLFVLYNF